MSHWTRSRTFTAATVLALAAVPGAIVTIRAPGVAQRRRVRKRRPAGICEWLREHRRRSCALRSAARVLRAHAVRPAAAPKRHRVRDVQRPVGQRRRVQLSRLPIHSATSFARRTDSARPRVKPWMRAEGFCCAPQP